MNEKYRFMLMQMQCAVISIYRHYRHTAENERIQTLGRPVNENLCVK